METFYIFFIYIIRSFKIVSAISVKEKTPSHSFYSQVENSQTRVLVFVFYERFVKLPSGKVFAECLSRQILAKSFLIKSYKDG